MQPTPRTARVSSYVFLFFSITSPCETPHKKTICIRMRRTSISKFSRRRERRDVEKYVIALLPLPRRSTHFDSESISGSTWRGGWFDRSIEAGSLVGTHHDDEIRVEARAILAGRVERSEASSLRLFSASSRSIRVRLFSRDRHVPPLRVASHGVSSSFR